MKSFIRLGFLVGMAALLVSCGKPVQPQPSRPNVKEKFYQLPTVTEIFNLKSTCVELSEKLMERKKAESDQMTKPFQISNPDLRYLWDVKSHYSSQHVTCYALITNVRQLNANTDMRFRDPKVKAIFDQSHMLYDAQTGEMLANYTTNVEHPNDETKVTAVFDTVGDFANSSDKFDYNKVMEHIDQLMRDP